MDSAFGRACLFLRASASNSICPIFDSLSDWIAGDLGVIFELFRPDGLLELRVLLKHITLAWSSEFFSRHAAKIESIRTMSAATLFKLPSIFLAMQRHTPSTETDAGSRA